MKYYFNPPNKKPNFGTSLIKKWKNNCRMKRERDRDWQRKGDSEESQCSLQKRFNTCPVHLFKTKEKFITIFIFFFCTGFSFSIQSVKEIFFIENYQTKRPCTVWCRKILCRPIEQYAIVIANSNIKIYLYCIKNSLFISPTPFPLSLNGHRTLHSIDF